MKSATITPPPNHAKLILALMILIIVGPMLFAWTLFFKGDLQQIRLSHHGDLIAPPINIFDETFHDPIKNVSFKGKALKGKWWLIFVGPQTCYPDCQNTLYNMQQLRLALGKNTSRLERLYIPNPYCPISLCTQSATNSYGGMKQAYIEKSQYDNLFGVYRNTLSNETIGELYLVDPKGNMMMYYPGDKEARDILSDLKRLLKTSKIG